ncbi:MAG: glycosyltransferase family 4 protein [Verrucomicrobia bacterium]|nr:glycosyltransferase family 4 protein [Verrucomicrobiota bacterium]
MTTDTVGGVWNYSLQLSQQLSARGVRIALATMGEIPSRGQNEAVKKISNLVLFSSSYRLEWMEDPWDDVAAAGAWLLKLERKVQADIIHLNGYAHGALAWKAPVCTVAHSCVLSWWEAVLHQPAPASWSRYRAVVSEGIRCSDRLVAPSNAMLNALQKFYGCLPPASVIYNGVASERFRPAEKWPMVFSAGRIWDKAKNIEAIAQCAAVLPWRFVIAGEGSLPGQMPNNVVLIGKVSSEVIAHYMSFASIYCLPARYEPFGLSVLEAALSGCALVLGDIESLRELWEGAAVFVSPDDKTALERELKRLMENEGHRKALGKLARRRARRFTAERIASAYLRLYRQMLPWTRSSLSLSAFKGRQNLQTRFRDSSR